MIATTKKTIKSPVSRYPGSKRLYLGALMADAVPVDAVIEPFAGAAHYSIARLQQGIGTAFLGETDPTVRALYMVWRSRRLHRRFRESVERRIALFEQDREEAWAWLNTEAALDFTDDRFHDLELSDDHLVSRASLGAVIRQLTFGGVIRCNASGEQNAPLVAGQADKLHRWEPNLECASLAECFSISSSYARAIESFGAADFCLTAEALIDPPYYAPRDKCPREQTPAYWGHKPHAVETLNLCLDAFELCLREPRIKRIVVTNYVSQALDIELRSIANRYDYQVQFVEGSTLKTMQRKTGKVGDGVNQGFWQVIRT